VTSLTVEFSRHIIAGPAEFHVRNLTTDTAAASADLSVQFDAATHRARVTFPGLAGQELAPGRYELRVLASEVSDVYGLPLQGDFEFGFHVQPGDANGDETTNDLDLYLVWQNQGRPPGLRDPGADLTGDGLVTQADVDVVRDNYLTRLEPPVLPLVGVGGGTSIPGALPGDASLAAALDRGGGSGTGAGSWAGLPLGVIPGGRAGVWGSRLEVIPTGRPDLWQGTRWEPASFYGIKPWNGSGDIYEEWRREQSLRLTERVGEVWARFL
jgi:hypothetical protein